MKLSISQSVGKTKPTKQTSDLGTPDLNVYLIDPQGNRYVNQQGDNYVLQLQEIA